MAHPKKLLSSYTVPVLFLYSSYTVPMQKKYFLCGILTFISKNIRTFAAQITHTNHKMNIDTYIKCNTLSGRYITQEMLTPVLEGYPFDEVLPLGQSVAGRPISLYRKGRGQTKLLLWSQMHGNESTTTKALFDVLMMLEGSPLLDRLSLYCIPILNPDGAMAYTRVNAAGVDLNRDALALTQPESRALRLAYDSVQPHWCFNLHDQRTIFSAGTGKHPATVSFLAPSYNEARALNPVRQSAMEVITAMWRKLSQHIPQQVGRFDDSFNLNCTGDRYTALGTPTILFEAGHYPEDYTREQTRQYVAMAMMEALQYIAINKVTGAHYEDYFSIPENAKCFFDVILRGDEGYNVGIMYREVLKEAKIAFEPYIAEVGALQGMYGHKELPLNELLMSVPKDKKALENAINWSVLYIK